MAGGGGDLLLKNTKVKQQIHFEVVSKKISASAKDSEKIQNYFPPEVVTSAVSKTIPVHGFSKDLCGVTGSLTIQLAV